jgi:hypothetical protein
MLQLDAYRQVFDILINSMTTYKPVLQRIRKNYDTALESAMKSSFDNMHLRTEVGLAEIRRDQAVDEALSQCAESSLALRDQLFAQLAEAETKAEQAENGADAADAAACDAKEELVLLHTRASELSRENGKLMEKMLSQTSWGSMPKR